MKATFGVDRLSLTTNLHYRLFQQRRLDCLSLELLSFLDEPMDPVTGKRGAGATTVQHLVTTNEVPGDPL